MIKRINNRHDVVGLVVLNQEGLQVKSTLDKSSTALYVTHMNHLIESARGCIRDIDPQNQLLVLRMRTKKNEVMVVPDKDYTLLVVQNVDAVKDGAK